MRPDMQGSETLSIAQSGFELIMPMLSFVAVRWLQNYIGSNEAMALLAPEAQL